MTVHLFGIRHHGPGSARSLLHALEQLEPDCLLVEGPPDGRRNLPLEVFEMGEWKTVSLMRISAPGRSNVKLSIFAAAALKFSRKA